MANSSFHTKAEIRAATEFNERLMVSQLNDLADSTSLRRLIDSQIELEKKLDALHADILPLQKLNADADIVDYAKNKIRATVAEYLAEHKAEQAERELKQRFDEMREKETKNKIFSKLHDYYLYQSISPTNNDDLIFGLTARFRNAAVTCLMDVASEHLLAPAKISVARKYFQTAIKKYLYVKVTHNANENNKVPITEETKKVLLQVINKINKLWEENPAQYISKLKQLLADKFLTPDELETLLNLDVILRANYESLDDFEISMIEFRKSQYSHFASREALASTFYGILPDLRPEQGDDYFPVIQFEKSKQSLLKGLQSYLTDLNAIKCDADQSAQLTQNRAEIMKLMNGIILSQREPAPIKALKKYLIQAMKLPRGTVIEILKKVLSVLLDQPKAEAKSPLEELLADDTIIEIIHAIDQYSKQEEKEDAGLKRRLLTATLTLELEEPLKSVVNSPEKTEQFLKNLKNYKIVKKEYKETTIAIRKLQTQLHARLDEPVINFLRAQVLHAAKLYFNPPQAVGLFHGWHHTEDGEKTVVKLIYDLFRPHVKTVADAMVLLNTFLTRHAAGKGLHTNSFDTLLMCVLYNGMTPKSFFHLSLDDMMKCRLKDRYPKFDPTASCWKNLPTEITSTHVKEMRTYLGSGYTILFAKPYGNLINMVRGEKRLDEAGRHVVRELTRRNFHRIAELFEQFRMGTLPQPEARPPSPLPR